MRISGHVFHFEAHVALSNIEYYKGNFKRW